MRLSSMEEKMDKVYKNKMKLLDGIVNVPSPTKKLLNLNQTLPHMDYEMRLTNIVKESKMNSSSSGENEPEALNNTPSIANL